MSDDPTSPPEPGAVGPEPVFAGRKQDGRFKKGQSGNPKGKQRGKRNKVTEMSEGLIGKYADKIVAKAIHMAVAEGDSTCIRLLLERIHPLPRDRKVFFDLPRNDAGALDIDASFAAIADGLGDGRLSPTEAVEIAKTIEAASGLKGMADLDARLKALETERDHG